MFPKNNPPIIPYFFRQIEKIVAQFVWARLFGILSSSAGVRHWKQTRPLLFSIYFNNKGVVSVFHSIHVVKHLNVRSDKILLFRKVGKFVRGSHRTSG